MLVGDCTFEVGLAVEGGWAESPCDVMDGGASAESGCDAEPDLLDVYADRMVRAHVAGAHDSQAMNCLMPAESFHTRLDKVG